VTAARHFTVVHFQSTH